MGTTSLRVVSEPEALWVDCDAIENAVNTYNMDVTGDRHWTPIRIFLRDARGTLCGGLIADVWGGWLHIRFLWVEEGFRREGWGSKLLRGAEEEARQCGCHSAHVETFSFQARPFYEKHGYAVLASLPNYPRGHTHYILTRRL